MGWDDRQCVFLFDKKTRARITRNSIFAVVSAHAKHLNHKVYNQFKKNTKMVMQKGSDALSKLQTVALFRPIRSLQCSW